MDWLPILLRIAHIFAGVMWVGGAAVYFFFLEPTARATAPESQKFIGYLMAQRQFSKFMTLASATTVLAGGLLYWRDSGFRLAWIATGPGLGFTIGALAGITVFGVGFFLIRPRADRLGALGREIQAAGAPPSAGQSAELSRIEADMSKLGRLDIVLLSIALLAMATARYWQL